MDNVLGHKPATQPPVVVDSGNYLDDQQSQWSLEILQNLSFNRFVCTSDDGASTTVSTEQSAGSQSSQSDQFLQAETTSKPKNKKCKRSKIDVTGEMIDKLIGTKETS